MSYLATLAQLKARIGLDAFDTAQDDFLTGMLALVTGRMEQESNRKFGRLAGATQEARGDALVLALERSPAEAVTKWELKSNETDGWEEQTGVDYLLRGAHTIELEESLGLEREILRVTYTGGYVLPGTEAESGQTALPGELTEACLQQAAYIWQNRDRLGVVSQWASGQILGGANMPDLLPAARAVCGKYRRITL
jgi:hypothetical protein